MRCIDGGAYTLRPPAGVLPIFFLCSSNLFVYCVLKAVHNSVTPGTSASNSLYAPGMIRIGCKRNVSTASLLSLFTRTHDCRYPPSFSDLFKKTTLAQPGFEESKQNPYADFPACAATYCFRYSSVTTERVESEENQRRKYCETYQFHLLSGTFHGVLRPQPYLPWPSRALLAIHPNRSMMQQSPALGTVCRVHAPRVC